MDYNFETPVDRKNTASLKWAKYKGTDILPFWVADMDFKAAPEIITAITERNSHGVFGYTVPGETVTQSVIDYLKRDHDYKIDPTWIVWTPGVVPAINLFCRAFGEKGSSVMTCTPVYPPFLTAPENADRNLIAVDLRWDGNRWTFDFEEMEARIEPDTKSFILCNPHNPVGRVFDKQELQSLSDFCVKHDLVICTDEIHSDLILEPEIKHIPTNLISEEIRKRSVMLTSPSKTYNIPGLCCAYAIIEDPKIRLAFKKVARGIITETNTFGYVACEAAYRYGSEWRLELIKYLRLNRDYLYEFISTHSPQVKLQPMEATYLAWLDVSALKLDDPISYFESEGIGLSAGSYFGAKDHVRLNFGCSRSVLETGLLRLKAAVDKLTA